MDNFFKKFDSFKQKAKEVFTNTSQNQVTEKKAIDSIIQNNFPSLNYQLKTLDKQKMLLGYFDQAFKNQEIFSKVMTNYFELNIKGIICYLGPELAEEREMLLEISRKSESSLNRFESIRDRQKSIFADFDETRRLMRTFEEQVHELMRFYSEDVRKFKTDPQFQLHLYNASFIKENISRFDYFNNQFDYIMQFNHSVQKYMARGITEGINVVCNLGMEKKVILDSQNDQTNKETANKERIEAEQIEDMFKNNENVDNDVNNKNVENESVDSLDKVFPARRSSYSFLHEDDKNNESVTPKKAEKSPEVNASKSEELFSMFVKDNKEKDYKEIDKKIQQQEKELFDMKNKIDDKIAAWKITDEGADKDIYQLISTMDEIVWDGCDFPKFGILEMSQDRNSLKKCYFKAMLKLHPDKVVRLDDEKKYLAGQLVSLLTIEKNKKTEGLQ
eukprot:GAHX01000271.1.p1 GENE.GAHX01000271.1~~GAHX01000271.1.p1  ORF type:complete len:446 (-),score=108.53 GAHX01000271.1:552-1889(-)